MRLVKDLDGLKKLKISKAKTGRKMSEQMRAKMRIISKNNKHSLGKHWKLSEDIKKKMCETQQKRIREGTHNWYIDGRTPIHTIIRNSKEMYIWRKSVFERDNYTCQECGIRGGELNADHIKPFSIYPELRFDLNNGRTLCYDCHYKTPTFGRNAKYLVRS